MSAWIHHIETAVPECSYPQAHTREVMKRGLAEGRLSEKLIHRIYSHSGIDKRHSVIDDFAETSDQTRYFDREAGKLKSPSTKTRNDHYVQAAKALGVGLAEQTLHACPGLHRADVTHLITVSCTGFFAPGLDYHIVNDLGLPPQVERFHLGFMGCYAAFPALKMAKAFCDANPDATVLIVCLELCTLHLQQSCTVDDLVAASVFADGAAAAIVRAHPPERAGARIERLVGALIPSAEEDMSWQIGDVGFEMALSSYVPKIVGNHIADALKTLLEPVGLELHDIPRWGIHPGGRAILDKVQGALQLSDAQLLPSRQVLREYGNMSSATILFVLKALFEVPVKGASEALCALAFGPGLTVESGLFRFG